MKNALILHGTGGSPQENWFDWLRVKLENEGWKVWVPLLPDNNQPNIRRYNQFLLAENHWDFNNESIIIGHSSGAVAILGLLQALPEKVMVDSCYLVGAFKDNLGRSDLTSLFELQFDFDHIKSHAKKIVFIHSDNDPYCPLDHAQYLAQQTGGELIIKPGQKHFSVGTYGEKYRQFPFLLDLIKSRS